MNTQSAFLEKPNLVNIIAWTTLASGIVNIMWGLAASATAFVTIIGIICIPLTILPSILGIFEILYAAKLLSNPPHPVQPAKTIAILEIVCILTGNVFSMVVGILSLVFYNDQIVRDYFARLNGTMSPAPITPVLPAPIEEPIPSPIYREDMPPVDEHPASESEPPDDHEKPKSSPE